MGTRNLILLTIDAWRPDFVDAHQGVPLCPSLEQVRAHCARFDAAYTTGPWTSPGLISLFTGESAARHGVHYEWSAPREGGPALARHLREAGYSVPNLCYLNRVGNYQHLGYAAADAPDYPHGPEDDLLLPALRAARGQREPFFLWYHYKYVHLPYWSTAAHRARMGIDDEAIPQRLRDSVCTGFVVPRDQHALRAEDQPLVQRLYAANVLQMNDWLGRVLEELLRGDLFERTTLVITADHGDELLEHGHVGHASTARHAQIHEEVLRIPLLFIDARLAPQRRPERVQLTDVLPTVQSLCGVAPQPVPGDGLDLAPLLLGEPGAALQNRVFYFRSSRMGYQTPRSHDGQEVDGFSDGQVKFIAERFADTPRHLLYDLRADPAEQRPQTEGEAVDQALELLAQLRHPGDPRAS